MQVTPPPPPPGEISYTSSEEIFKDDRAFGLLHQQIPKIFVLCMP